MQAAAGRAALTQNFDRVFDAVKAGRYDLALADLPALSTDADRLLAAKEATKLKDGDTVSIGGIIQEADTTSSAGIPLLHRIPFLGAVFGSKSGTKARTELIVFLTPRVIYDTNQIAEATDELRSKMKRLERMIKE